MKTGMRIRLAWLLALLLSLTGIAMPSAAFAAEGDPTLRFDMRTKDSVSGLKSGDEIEVEVVMSRSDGLADAYRFYGVQLDIRYNNQLFTVSELKNAGLKRPDGENWKGGWTCTSINGAAGTKQIRVLCTNLGLAGGLGNADVVPGGEVIVGSFLLTVGQDAPDQVETVDFAKVLNIGSDLKKGPAEVGSVLSLAFAVSESIGGSGSGTGSGSGSGGSGSGSGTSGSGQSGSGTGTTEGSSSAGTDAAGQAPPSDGSKPRVRFEELTDVPQTHWAADSIRYLVDRGIVVGNAQKQFEPEKRVTRAEFCQMAANAFGYEQKGSGTAFSDVGENDWYCGAVTALAEAGVVSGTGSGRFGAEDALSRQDMAVILYRIMRDRNMTPPVIREFAVFDDEAAAADYAREALMELYCTGVISGTSRTTLSPAEFSTRAQIASVLMKLLQSEVEGR
ncbi:S-layer homology domain-containing protein [Bacilliculturomica massiliensis]|uniref:S-layer homology domain-containing protein n=1 Tax=Bacilliculturomica massiliensis TaxID=1917867 RepID=UPI001030F0A0|nr:S-layer homology domain-containing protein [Bacilliculturomica massiliensis]